MKMWQELLKSRRVEPKLTDNQPMPKEVEAIMDVYNNTPHYLVRRQLIAFLIELGYGYDQLKQWNAKTKKVKKDVDGESTESESEGGEYDDQPPDYKEVEKVTSNSKEKVWSPFLSRYHCNKAKLHLLRTSHGLNPVYKEVKVMEFQKFLHQYSHI